MTTDDTRPRSVIQIVATVAVAIGSVPAAAVLGFGIGPLLAYWTVAFVALLVASGLDGDEGVDIAGAVAWWVAAAVGACVVWFVVVVVAVLTVDWGFDLCDENWDGGPDEDCF